jgi:lipopolysaccharide transport system permease protein
MNNKITHITSKSTSIGTYLSDIYHYRYLIYTLTLRDIKLRYTQTTLGWFWAVMQPIITMAVFTFFFVFIIKINTGDIPYPLIALSGILIWNYFGSIANSASISLISSQELIKKMRFPKICLLISKTFVGLSDFLIAFIILFIAIIMSDISITINILYLPVLIILNIITSFTFALWFSALTFKNRDLLNLIPHIITLGTWITPVFYMSTMIPTQFSFLTYLNPIAGIIEGVRFSLLGTSSPSKWYLLGISSVLILFIGGLFYFKNIEKDIAEYI